MENVEKLRVLLQHWIDHNKGHAEEFAKWEKCMADEEYDKGNIIKNELVKHGHVMDLDLDTDIKDGHK